jgi:hypothetical protein
MMTCLSVNSTQIGPLKSQTTASPDGTIAFLAL